MKIPLACILFLCTALTIGVSARHPQCKAFADILFILDGSESIKRPNFVKLKLFVANMTSRFDIGAEEVEFGILLYSSQVENALPFSSTQTKASVVNAIQSLEYLNGGTRTNTALKYARENCFEPSNGARNRATKIAIVVTDGESHDPPETIKQAKLLKQSGVTTIAIGVGSEVNDLELKAIASSDSMVFKVDNFDVLDAIAENVVTWTCPTPDIGKNCTDTCLSNYECINGVCGCPVTKYIDEQNAKCTRIPDITETCTRQTLCLSNYKCINGVCDCPERKVYNEQTAKCEVEDLPPSLPKKCIGNGTDSCKDRPDGNYEYCDPHCRSGYYVTCSNERFHSMPCALSWYLNSKNERFTAKMVYIAASNTCEKEADYCPRDPWDYQEKTRNNEECSKNSRMCSEKQNQECVYVYGRYTCRCRCGFTQNGEGYCEATSSIQPCLKDSCAGHADGNYPACNPKCKEGFYVTCANEFKYEMPCPLGWYVGSDNKRFLAKMVYDPASDSCERQVGYCPRDSSEYKEDIPAPPPATTNVPSEDNCQHKTDILFIVDASESIGQDNYEIMKDFLAKFTQNFDMEQRKIRFSALVFSDNVADAFSFGKYTDNTNVDKGLRTLPYLREGTDTAAALRRAKSYSFTAANGHRNRANKIAVVLTDGESKNVTQTKEAAQALRDTGVAVVAIGVGSKTNSDELLSIASNGRVFKVREFSVLSNIENDLLQRTCIKPSVPPPSVCLDCKETCDGKSDGDYAACRPTCTRGIFYSCVAGIKYVRQCAVGWYHVGGDKKQSTAPLVFDPATRRCEFKTSYCPRSDMALPVS